MSCLATDKLAAIFPWLKPWFRSRCAYRHLSMNEVLRR